jgi:hypothetical protein
LKDGEGRDGGREGRNDGEQRIGTYYGDDVEGGEEEQKFDSLEREGV